MASDAIISVFDDRSCSCLFSSFQILHHRFIEVSTGSNPSLSQPSNCPGEANRLKMQQIPSSLATIHFQLCHHLHLIQAGDTILEQQFCQNLLKRMTESEPG
jgi:hypothetical protein